MPLADLIGGDELAILAWCSRPIVPVLNFIATDEARTATWREHLARVALHAVAEEVLGHLVAGVVAATTYTDEADFLAALGSLAAGTPNGSVRTPASADGSPRVGG